jgi:CxxC motif-containing protein (DUF1111 family)
LTPAQRATHLAGDAEFARTFGPAEGLGPLFVSTSCESCHIGDGKGHPVTTLTRFGRYAGDTFDPLLDLGGPQLQHRSIPGYPIEAIPVQATGVTRLMPPAVTGLGYLEAVSGATLLALADPNDADGDGISGVPNWIDPPDFLPSAPDLTDPQGRRIGRFGKKASAVSLLHQTVGAYLNDMGITTDELPEDQHNVQAGPATGDLVLDPEVSTAVVQNVVFYLRTLKAPPRRDETDAQVVAGSRLFAEIGCDRCHIPMLSTGPSEIEALRDQVIYPYTDLLLHDMGPDLDDGYTEGTAKTFEWRTAPLWGLGLAADSQGGSAFYLHDGRATSLADAIRYHGGEATRSRQAFEQLGAEAQDQVITFLFSL